MNSPGLIVFDNLKQKTSVIGQYDKVSVVCKPFVSSNAHGLLREVKDYEEVGNLAAQSGKRIKELLAEEE